MIEWDYESIFMERTLFPERDRRFICTVNGERTFHGEELPCGTRYEIEKWITDRYALNGKMFLLQRDDRLVFWEARCRWSYHLWGWSADPVRLLVTVRGVEYLFLLTPIRGLRLTWDGGGRRLTWDGDKDR